MISCSGWHLPGVLLQSDCSPFMIDKYLLDAHFETFREPLSVTELNDAKAPWRKEVQVSLQRELQEQGDEL